jgi:hypothetical protein
MTRLLDLDGNGGHVVGLRLAVTEFRDGLKDRIDDPTRRFLA